MNSEDIRLAILRDAYNRTKKGETVLFSPQQYSTESGIPEDDVKLALRYLIDKNLLNGRITTSIGGPPIFEIISITKIGMDWVEHPQQSPKPQPVLDLSRDVTLVSGALSNFSATLPPGFQQGLQPIMSAMTQIESEVRDVQSMVRQQGSWWGQLKSQAVGAVIGFVIGVVLTIALRYLGLPV